MVYYNDPDLIFAPDGAIEALEQAKKQGKVRFVGFTGHKDPAIHLKMLSHNFPFDTVQMPLNCFDATFRSFETSVLPELNRRGHRAARDEEPGRQRRDGDQGRDHCRRKALRYAMSLPVAVTISGMDSLDVLHQNLAIARGFQPMSAAEMQRCGSAAKPTRPTAATNYSRPQRSMTATWAGSSMASVRQRIAGVRECRPVRGRFGK